jgi:hypothetical protein
MCRGSAQEFSMLAGNFLVNTYQCHVLGRVVDAIPPLMVIRHSLTCLLQPRSRYISVGVPTEESILHRLERHLGWVVQAENGRVPKTEVDEWFIRLGLGEVEARDYGSDLVLGSTLQWKDCQLRYSEGGGRTHDDRSGLDGPFFRSS